MNELQMEKNKRVEYVRFHAADVDGGLSKNLRDTLQVCCMLSLVERKIQEIKIESRVAGAHPDDAFFGKIIIVNLKPKDYTRKVGIAFCLRNFNGERWIDDRAYALCMEKAKKVCSEWDVPCPSYWFRL